MTKLDVAKRVLNFNLRKRVMLFRKNLLAFSEPETVPSPEHILPGSPESTSIRSYPLQQTEGHVSVYKRGSWYELVVVSFIHGDLIPFFVLRGRHRKFEVADKRAQKVAIMWGED